jgi:hypothetical protein
MASYFWLISALYFLKQRNIRRYGVALLFGVVTKETILLTLPVAAALAIGGYLDRDHVPRLIGWGFFGSLLFVGIRYLYSGSVSDQTSRSVASLIEHHLTELPTEIASVVILFNFMWLSPFFWREFNKYLRIAFPILFATSTLQLFLATDAMRVLAINFPIMIPGGLMLLTKPSIPGIYSNHVRKAIVYMITVSLLLGGNLLYIIYVN